MREDEIVRVVVRAVHDYGVDVEFEGQVGFIQPIELSWRSDGVTPHDTVRPGDRIDVYVYAITPGRFFASLKRARPDLNPWAEPSKYAAASRHRGIVKCVVEWGCEVEIANSVRGMILTDRFPGQYVPGHAIDVEVVSVEPGLKKIELKPLS
jgi:ribosomal protein S1